jgi:D-glycero-D-manno-heptose 1,7-bisphosphate phosphatase
MLSMNPAIFLDRDGVIIENRRNYVRSWADVAIYDNALEALAYISRYPLKVVIVTNQSVIGRGLISLNTASEINTRLVDEIHKAGGRVDGVFMCPHAPEDHCVCRKPKPGLFYQAAQELSLDLARSILVGDALSDIKAGRAAGLEQSVLVKTGLGNQQLLLPEAISLQPFPVFDSLSDALTDLVVNLRR